MKSGIYYQIANQLRAGQTVAIATILKNVGSSPRSAGAKMVVCADGSFFGTIGGGKLEAETLISAVEAIRNGIGHLAHFDLTATDASQSEMICGGYGDVLIAVASPNDLAVFDAAATAETDGKEGWLLTQFVASGGANRFCFIRADGTKIAPFACESFDLTRLRGTPAKIAIHSDILERADLLVEALSAPTRLFVFGGGHVAKETVFLANLAEFRTIVCDDRPEYVNEERFPDSVCVLLDSYTDCSRFEIRPDDFIVIVTRGHLGDYDVLKWALTTDAAYIGMIGSHSKREKIYARLREEGVSNEAIARVVSPIGIPIAGETPFEIAISILAQLIDVRGKRKGRQE